MEFYGGLPSSSLSGVGDSAGLEQKDSRRDDSENQGEEHWGHQRKLHRTLSLLLNFHLAIG